MKIDFYSNKYNINSAISFENFGIYSGIGWYWGEDSVPLELRIMEHEKNYCCLVFLKIFKFCFSFSVDIF